MKLLWEERAWDEYTKWLSEDKKMLRRINQLIRDIRRNPFDGIGKPEPLKGNLAGWWSRRIDEANRIVYMPDGDKVIIPAVKGHYDDEIR